MLAYAFPSTIAPNSLLKKFIIWFLPLSIYIDTIIDTNMSNIPPSIPMTLCIYPVIASVFIICFKSIFCISPIAFCTISFLKIESSGSEFIFCTAIL